MARGSFVAVIVTVVACSRTFGLIKPAPVGDGGFGDGAIDANFGSACDPLAYDSLRYAYVTSGSTGYSVATAALVCQTLGMELVSFDADDAAELSHQLNGAPLPFWTGTSWIGSAWTNQDGCTPYVMFGSGNNALEAPDQCVMMTNNAEDAQTCSHLTYNTAPLNGLCETPRPSTKCRRYAAERAYQMIQSAAVTYDVAVTMCPSGSHLVEINSSDELGMVDALARSAGASSYWVGATYSSPAWTSPTGCPQVFTWEQVGAHANQPSSGLPGNHQVIREIAGMWVAPANDAVNASAYVICETNS